MQKMIACCGLDCGQCDAYLATIQNDDSLREKVATLWSKLNGVTITRDMINCLGCRTDGVKTPFCDKLCEIRKCCSVKGYETCGDCNESEFCEKLSMVTGHNAEAKERLKK